MHVAGINVGIRFMPNVMKTSIRVLVFLVVGDVGSCLEAVEMRGVAAISRQINLKAEKTDVSFLIGVGQYGDGGLRCKRYPLRNACHLLKTRMRYPKGDLLTCS